MAGDKFDAPRQSGGLCGAGSLETLPRKTIDDIDSQSESNEDDSDFSDKIEGVEPDLVDNLCPADIWCEINKWCGGRIGKGNLKRALF